MDTKQVEEAWNYYNKVGLVVESGNQGITEYFRKGSDLHKSLIYGTAGEAGDLKALEALFRGDVKQDRRLLLLL